MSQFHSIDGTPLGLTEPLFVPAYWKPPRLFDLAAHTAGFDIESLIFSVGIGVLGAVLYNIFTKREIALLTDAERCAPRHRHRLGRRRPVISTPALWLIP